MRTTRILLTVAALPLLAQSVPSDKPEPPTAAWTYEVKRDEMRETAISTATTPALDGLGLAFPYESATGLLALRGANGVAMTIVGATTGIVSCDPSCVLMVKFDNAKAVEWRAFTYGDPGSLVDLADPDKFIARLRASSRVAIEVPFYENGLIVMRFDVAALKWPPAP